MKASFDLVIVGAGPAGLAAAGVAAANGVRVALVDDNAKAGGQVWRQGPATQAPRALSETLSTLTHCPNFTLFAGARISAFASARDIIVESQQQGGLSLSFEKLIIAAGARERLLPFPGWTLPGVTGAGGLQALIKGGMPVRGERVVLAGSGPLLLAALATARSAGARVVAVIEQAPRRALLRFGVSLAATPSKAWQALQLTRGFASLPYWTGSVLREAQGDAHVQAALVRRGNRDITIACDRIACGYGLVPNVAVAQALGCTIAQGAIEVDETQRTSVDHIWAAGECTGIGGMELARVEGEIAGLSACGMPAPAHLLRERDRWRGFVRRLAHTFDLTARAREWPSAETILCRCEDVPFGDVATHRSWRDAKLHTRCGMGPCQGRICGAAAQTYFGWDAAAPRPPFAPTRIGAFIEARQASDARL